MNDILFHALYTSKINDPCVHNSLFTSTHTSYRHTPDIFLYYMLIH